MIFKWSKTWSSTLTPYKKHNPTTVTTKLFHYLYVSIRELQPYRTFKWEQGTRFHRIWVPCFLLYIIFIINTLRYSKHELLKLFVLNLYSSLLTNPHIYSMSIHCIYLRQCIGMLALSSLKPIYRPKWFPHLSILAHTHNTGTAMSPILLRRLRGRR